MSEVIKFEVGKPYPGEVIPANAAAFEIRGAGQLVLRIRIDEQTSEEAKALQNGFRQCSLYDSPSGVAAFIFKFAHPINCIRVPFFIVPEEDHRIELTDSDLIHLVILDGTLITAVKTICLQHEFADHLQKVVDRQALIPLLDEVYEMAMEQLYQKKPDELFAAGTPYHTMKWS
jgi:hypothetical protein